jgi:hypothetical protein
MVTPEFPPLFYLRKVGVDLKLFLANSIYSSAGNITEEKTHVSMSEFLTIV